jgi:hypothetical protein
MSLGAVSYIVERIRVFENVMLKKNIWIYEEVTGG